MNGILGNDGNLRVFEEIKKNLGIFWSFLPKNELADVSNEKLRLHVHLFYYLYPQNTKCPEGQIRHLIYLLENAVINLPPDQEQMVWLIDFTGWSFTTAVSVKLTYETTSVLQNHYPERLAYAILYNPPRIFQAFWKV